MFAFSFFFCRITQYIGDPHNTRTLPMNTRTQTLPRVSDRSERDHFSLLARSLLLQLTLPMHANAAS
jgi:hypothetical protein